MSVNGTILVGLTGDGDGCWGLWQVTGITPNGHVAGVSGGSGSGGVTPKHWMHLGVGP